MGYYIDPPDQTKEEWLLTHGTLCDEVPLRHVDTKTNSVAVVLVDNIIFQAAGIAYSQAELEAFKHEDPRPKEWYWVPIEKLTPEICNGHNVQKLIK